MEFRRYVPLAAAVMIVAAPQVASPQGRWNWPEKAENLKVLPEDTGAAQLRSIMFGFTRALGVRCAHCHVGEPDSSLSTYDFVSDDRPAKATAREMLLMLGDINGHLKKIEPSGAKPVNMWCHTCHRGQARPQTLTETLSETYAADGADATLTRYKELREKFYGRGSFDFGEDGLNALGYDLLGEGHVEDAIAVFEANAEQFPESANVWDSLAEACVAAGQKDRAIELYEKSLALDPRNRNAEAKLKELRGETPGE